MGMYIIWCGINFGCAALFVGIGIFAFRYKSAMWFWAGDKVDPETITDLKAYNRANGLMWIGYSLWYWLAGISWFFSQSLALISVVVGCTAGIGLLLLCYHWIEKKYKK